MTETLNVVFTGLVIVFLVLLALTFIVKMIGLLIDSITGASKRKKEQAAAETKPPVQPAAVQSDSEEDGIPDEVVAAITAAVSYMMQDAGEPGKTYAVKSIKRAREARPVWSMAGIADNTRPF